MSINVQQDATINSLFYLQTALHVSCGLSTHHQEDKQLYLQHLVLVNCDCYLSLCGGVETDLRVLYSLNTIATGSSHS